MINKRKSIIFALAVCAQIFGIAALAAGCANTNKWNVSADKSDNINAELISAENGLTLKITGKGDMQDWNSYNDVPWKDKSDEIARIKISEGINHIGSYAFYGIEETEPILLPSSVTSAGEKFICEKSDLFVFDNDIEFVEIPESLYTYREQNIVTHDRYWQSDKSKTDIINVEDNLNADSGKYWRYNEDDVAVKYEKTKVLFIGNSFTYRNGVIEHSSGVPGIFDNIAEDLGYCTETYSVTGPGWYLDNHAKSTDVCGKQVDMLLNACDDFDYIVLQDQSQVAYKNNTRFINGISALKNKIKQTQKHAEIYLYETWGSPFSANEDKITVPEMEKKLRDAYTAAGNDLGLRVSYIGKAFTDIYRHFPSINLYATDNRHQGYTGAYLSACVHVASMLGGDVRKTEFVGEEKYSAPALDAQILTALKESAYNVVFGEIDENDNPDTTEPNDPDEDNTGIIKIACWGRFMKEAKFTELIEDFKNYCKENDIENKEIAAKYYDGSTNNSPYYYIADFTAKVLADGDADIILPCADNFNANQSNLAAVNLLAIDVYGQSNRRVAALNDDSLTKEFFIYIQTDSAKAILTKQD